MTRFEELKSKLDGIDEAKKGFILSLLTDFVWLEEQINELRQYPRYLINPKDPRQQKKLVVHDIIKDYQAQKNDIATKILKVLEDGGEDSDDLLNALKEFE